MTDREIANAKNVDLMELIDKLEIPYILAGDHANILCFKHDELKLSLAIYSDHIFCYGCSYRNDSIGFIQDLFKTDFQTAVKFLNNIK